MGTTQYLVTLENLRACFKNIETLRVGYEKIDRASKGWAISHFRAPSLYWNP